MVVIDQALPSRIKPADVHFGRLLATILAAVFYLLGWVPAQIVRGSWFAIAWAFAAAQVGWRDAYTKPTP